MSTSRPAPEQFAAGRTGGCSPTAPTGSSRCTSPPSSPARSRRPGWPPPRSATGSTVVDTRSTGMGLGFPVLAAAAAADRGRRPCRGTRRPRSTPSTGPPIFFYVDTLEFLRRGGRINAAEALLGTALSVKPIMHMPDGAIVLRDKVRTASRGVARLVDLAVEAAGDAEVDLAVHHLAAPQRAEQLRRRADRPARRPAARHVRHRGRRGGRRARRAGPGLRGRPPPRGGGYGGGGLTAPDLVTAAEPARALPRRGMIRALSTVRCFVLPDRP